MCIFTYMYLVYLYLYVSIPACTAYIHAYIRVRTCVYAYIPYIWILIKYIPTYLCIYTHTYRGNGYPHYVNLYTRVCGWMWESVCACARAYIRIYMYTHIHIHIFLCCMHVCRLNHRYVSHTRERARTERERERERERGREATSQGLRLSALCGSN